jgi:molecular chaperone DnaJ
MEKRKDFYSLLGVARDASPSAIRRAYQKLARQFRPGKGVHSASPELQALKTAYETLADAERRRRYDAALGEIETDRFAAFEPGFVTGAQGELRRPVERGSLSGEILLTRREAMAGGTVPLDIPIAAPCAACDGTGGRVFDCGRCGGEGLIQRRFPIPVSVPPGVRDGTVFQVRVDEPAKVSLILTIHIRPL